MRRDLLHTRPGAERVESCVSDFPEVDTNHLVVTCRPNGHSVVDAAAAGFSHEKHCGEENGAKDGGQTDREAAFRVAATSPVNLAANPSLRCATWCHTMCSLSSATSLA